MKRPAAALLLAAGLVAGACATSAEPEAMTPQRVEVARSHRGVARVLVRGGGSTHVAGHPQIKASAFESALVAATVECGLFDGVTTDPGVAADWLLSVYVGTVSYSIGGDVSTADLSVDWFIHRPGAPEPVWHATVDSSADATPGDSILRPSRECIAAERAAQIAIVEGLLRIGEADLPPPRER